MDRRTHFLDRFFPKKEARTIKLDFLTFADILTDKKVAKKAKYKVGDKLLRLLYPSFSSEDMYYSLKFMNPDPTMDAVDYLLDFHVEIDDLYRELEGFVKEYLKSEYTDYITQKLVNLINEARIIKPLKKTLLNIARMEDLPLLLACVYFYVLKGTDAFYEELEKSPVFEQYRGIVVEIMPFPYSNIPPQNNYFMGRAVELSDIQRNFQEGKTIQTITGMGGIGKSQLARAYAHLHKEKYTVSLRLIADKPETLRRAALNFLIYKKMATEKDSDAFISGMFKNYFSDADNVGEWLLIFDNVEEKEDIADYLPENPNGHILITSRNTINYWGEPVPLRVFDETLAVSFLQGRAGSDDEKNAALIAKRLDYLPLALEQAGAFIDVNKKSHGMNGEKYLSLLEDASLTLLAKMHGVTDYNTPVTLTWKITMGKIQKDSAAHQLLYMCAYFTPDYIDLYYLAGCSEALPPPLRDKIADEPSQCDIVTELTKYSLMQCEDGWLSIHRLLQEVIRADIGADTKYIYDCLDFVRMADELSPHYKQQHENRPAAFRGSSNEETIAKHARAILNEKDDKLQIVSDIFLECSRIYYMIHGNDLKKGIEYISEALSIRRKLYGDIHISVAEAYMKMSEAYRQGNDYKTGLECLEKAKDIYEQIYGENAPETASVYDEIYSVYDWIDEYNLALQWHKKALTAKGIESAKAEDLIEVASLYIFSRIREDEPDIQRMLYDYANANLVIDCIYYNSEPIADVEKYYNIASEQTARGQFAAALESYKKALELQVDILAKQDDYFRDIKKHALLPEPRMCYSREFLIRSIEENK